VVADTAPAQPIVEWNQPIAEPEVAIDTAPIVAPEIEPAPIGTKKKTRSGSKKNTSAIDPSNMDVGNEVAAYDLFKQAANDDAALYFRRAHREKKLAEPTDNVDESIEKYVDKEMMLFLEKGEYEKTPDYLTRINSANRSKKIRELASKELEQFVQHSKKEISVKDFKISRYNADSETFDLITSERQYTVNIPIKDAPSFKNNFQRMQIRDMIFMVEMGELLLSGFAVTNPENGKMYAFRSSLATTYDIEALEENFTVKLGEFSPEDAKPVPSSAPKAKPKATPKPKPTVASKPARPDDPIAQDSTVDATVTEENGAMILKN
ncbi:MAG: hypothetical protein LBS94_02915, partial [Prevotellaceae bacterium]|nr:hypothetical protein [Prevotellaceae bacterium]